MQSEQLKLELWQELEEATQALRFVDFDLLWSMLEEAIRHLPQAQQLAIAGNAIEQMAEVIRLRSTMLISEWEAAHTRIDSEAPIVEAAMLEAWVRQSMAVNLNAFIEPPRSTRQRQAKVKLASTDSVVAEIEPVAILQMLDQLDQEQNAEKMGRDLVEEENVAGWSTVIHQWLRDHANETPVALLHLQRELQMPWVEVWLGLLLGGFELRQIGEFYEPEIWINTVRY